MKGSIRDKLKENRFIYKVIHNIVLFINKLKGGIQGSGNVIKDISLISDIKYDIIGNNNSIFFNEGSRISNLKVFIRGNNHKISIGKNCIIKMGVIWIEDENCSLIIGDDTTIEDVHFGITEPNSKIEVGNDCMFSSGIRILTGDSHSILALQTLKRINYAGNVKIDSHVWVGQDVLILKGVEIAHDTIIGSRSIITKNQGPNSIVAGAPAKQIKENVTWDRKRIYL